MPAGVPEPRLDRTLRITAGVLGIVVAVPSFLAFLFVVLFVWLGSTDVPLWLAAPLGLLAIVQLYLSIRTLSGRLASALAVGLLGALELAVGVFLLVGSPTLLPATVAAIVVIFIAGALALAVAVRMRRPGPGTPQPAAARIRDRREQSVSPDAPQPMRSGARAKPAQKPGTAAKPGPTQMPSTAPKSGIAQKSGAKKSGRKR